MCRVTFLILLTISIPTAEAQLIRPRPHCPPVAPLHCPPLTNDPFLHRPPAGTTDPMNPMPPMSDPAVNPNLPRNLEDAFAQANPRGGTSSPSFNENFTGDFGGLFATQQIIVGYTTETIFTETETFVTVETPIYRTIRVPIGARYNGILITENDSPRPVDRVYYGFNRYYGFGESFNGFSTPMERQTMGFEKTVLNGNGSFGMRLPFLRTDDQFGFGVSGTSDLSLLFKYAFYNNLATGDLASAGMILTLPTGPEARLMDGTKAPDSVIFQPWLGGIRMFDRGYTQAITSLVLSRDSREPVLFNNSMAAGWFLYRNMRDRMVQSITPTLEVHIRTPLTQRDPSGSLFFQDQVNFTSAIHFRTRNATISPALNVPTVGPRPWNSEFMIWVNFRF